MSATDLPMLAYERARSIPEALTLLAEGGEDARPLGGGMSLVPMMNLGLAAPALLVDVTAIPAMRQVDSDSEHVTIGAALTHHELTIDPVVVEQVPLLALAAAHIGSRRIRNRGTIGGSVAHGDAAAELPLCCHVLDADYMVQSRESQQWRDAQSFSQGYYQTDLRPGELVTAIRVPRRRGWGWGFREYSRRAGDFALAAAAVGVSIHAGVIDDIAIGVSGAADRATRLSALEQRLRGAQESRVRPLLEGLRQEFDVPDDPYCSGEARGRFLEAMVVRAVADACEDTRRTV